MLVSVKLYVVILICISLRINHVDHLFKGLFAVCMFSLEKYLFKFFPIFKPDYTSFYHKLVRVLYISLTPAFYQMYDFQIFSSAVFFFILISAKFSNVYS